MKNRPYHILAALVIAAPALAAAPARAQTMPQAPQQATPQPNQPWFADPQALGKAFDGVGRMMGRIPPQPCPSGQATCYQGPTLNQWKALGAFSAFTHEFAPYGYGYARRGYRYGAPGTE